MGTAEADFLSHPQPAQSYEEAIKRYAASLAHDTNAIKPELQSQLMTHGQKVDKAIVFLHGLTSSPPQFHKLGKLFFERGYNVYIPRMPKHGYKDRMTTALEHLTIGEMLAYTDEAVDLAQGLGEQVILSGISLGGVLTTWAAQFRSDLDLAVPIAPAFAPVGIPEWLAGPIDTLAVKLPNFFIWWNPFRKNVFGTGHSYPRFSSYALARCFRIGEEIYKRSFVARPLARALLVVMTAHDQSVNNNITEKILRNWQRQGTQHLAVYRFKHDMPWLHDIIEPTRSDQRTDLVYPVLIRIIEQMSTEV